MSEVLTMNETPADQPQFNADEQNSLEVAESISGYSTHLRLPYSKLKLSIAGAHLTIEPSKK